MAQRLATQASSDPFGMKSFVREAQRVADRRAKQNSRDLVFGWHEESREQSACQACVCRTRRPAASFAAGSEYPRVTTWHFRGRLIDTTEVGARYLSPMRADHWTSIDRRACVPIASSSPSRWPVRLGWRLGLGEAATGSRGRSSRRLGRVCVHLGQERFEGADERREIGGGSLPDDRGINAEVFVRHLVAKTSHLVPG